MITPRRTAANAATLPLLVTANAFAARAQQGELDTLKAQIAALQAQLDTLESEQKKAAEAAAKTAPTVATNSRLPLKINGNLQVHYLAYAGQGDTPVARQYDTFRLRRGVLRFTASVTPRITNILEIDPARTLTQNAQGIINQRSHLVNEAEIQYLLSKHASGSHYVDVGQFKIPIGYEGDLVSSTALQTIDRALMFTQRDPFGGGYGDVYDTGVALRGSFKQFDYRLGLFNGLGERQNQRATSDNKAIAARFVYRFTPALQLGVSGGTGHMHNMSGTARSERHIWNLFSVYRKAPWTLQAEYMQGHAQVVPTNSEFLRDVRGYYANIGYMFTPKLEGVLRYDYFNTNRDLDHAAVRDLVLGVNYYIKGNNAKIQANLVRRNSAENAPTAVRDDRTELRTNFQVAF